LYVFNKLQHSEHKSLLAMAEADPKWFYKTIKGCYPRSIEFSVDVNLELLSRPELENQLRTLLEILQAGNQPQIIDVTPAALPGPCDEENKV